MKERFIKAIIQWESEMGESFTDYFMHDNVKNVSWAFWLLGKGHTEFALTIIKEIEAGETCIDQDTLYDVFGEDWEKNVEIWAEFLSATNSYIDRTSKFFKDNDVEV